MVLHTNNKCSEVEGGDGHIAYENDDDDEVEDDVEDEVNPCFRHQTSEALLSPRISSMMCRLPSPLNLTSRRLHPNTSNYLISMILSFYLR